MRILLALVLFLFLDRGHAQHHHAEKTSHSTDAHPVGRPSLLKSAPRSSSVSHHGIGSKIRKYHLVLEEKSIGSILIDQELKESADTALMTVNGSIPGPTLDFVEGETAEIAVENKMSVESSIHWHGILLPPQEDGVPYVNTPPILPGQTYTFQFLVRQNGTYWYHSHTHLQEQKGLYGAIRIFKSESDLTNDDQVVVLSDFTTEQPESILKNLKKDGDYYLYKKNNIRSYVDAVQKGKLFNQLYNEWTRMGGMDMSDVGYDAFLANGRRVVKLARKRDRTLRLRLVNGSASSYFQFISPVDFKVLSSDGMDVQPLISKRILLGMAETYDIEIPASSKNIVLYAVAQDGTGHASISIENQGGSEGIITAELPPKPDLYMRMDHSAHSSHASDMDHSAHTSHASDMDHSAHSSHASGMDHSVHTGQSPITGHSEHHSALQTQVSEETSIERSDEVTVDALKALSPMTDKAPDQTIKFELFGDMRRYVWHLNGKTIVQDRWVDIKQGDVVRFIYENKSMMHHPMHLHGHFFRVLTDKGVWSPLKHTVDVPPHQTRTIQFVADEPGRWMLHCHNLYHMSTGMARVIRYQSYKASPVQETLDRQDHHRHDPMFNYGRVELASNHLQAEYKWMDTWNEYVLRGELAETSSKFDSFKNYENEVDVLYRRWFGNYLYFTGGLTSYHSRGHGAVGFGYTLPLLVQIEALAVSNENVRLRVARKIQWTKHFSSDVDWTYRPSWNGKRDSEFEATLMYASQWNLSYGLMVTEKKMGVGLSYQF